MRCPASFLRKPAVRKRSFPRLAWPCAWLGKPANNARPNRIRQAERQASPHARRPFEFRVYRRKIRHRLASHQEYLIVERPDLHIPLGFEGVRTRPFFAAAEIKPVISRPCRALHQLPIHEVVRCQPRCFRPCSRIVGEHLVPKIKAGYGGYGFVPAIDGQNFHAAAELILKIREEPARKYRGSMPMHALAK